MAHHGLVALGAEEFAQELIFSPTTATWLGDHRFDDRMDDVRVDSLNRERDRLRIMHERVRQAAFDPENHGPQESLDVRLLLARIETQLQDLEGPNQGERNPIFYMNLIAFGIDSLLWPDFVPVEPRVRMLLRRLQAVPDLCREAQRNLKNPPEIFTRRAIEMGLLTRDFLTTLLPRLIRGVTDRKLLDDFNRANDEAHKALDELITWMTRDLLPRSKGDFVLGRERLLSRLRAAEMLDVPLETVQAPAERELNLTRARLEEVTRRLLGSATFSPRILGDALRMIEEDHSKPDDLLETAESILNGLYSTIADQDLLSLPQGRPRILEMPPYRWGFMQLYTPGPLETRSRESFFYIDPVDAAWKDKKQISDHLRMLSRTQMLLSMGHEVVPGHFVQQEQWRRSNAGLSLIRQRSRSQGFIEGWGQYAGQLLTEVLPGNDRLQLLWLRAQLTRLGRLLMALRLHGTIVPAGAGGPSSATRLDEIARLLAEECYLDEYAARHEAERLAYDPMVLMPALGRLQLLKLRDDYRTEQGGRFFLRSFHNAVLSQGEVPIVALRQILLSQQGPSL